MMLRICWTCKGDRIVSLTTDNNRKPDICPACGGWGYVAMGPIEQFMLGNEPKKEPLNDLTR